MPFIKTSLFIILIALPAALHAVEPLKLDRAIEEARANNPEILSIRQRIQAKEAGARAERYLEDPALKVEMEDLSRSRPLDIAPGNAMLTRYTLSQSFPFPGKLSLREKIAVKEAQGIKAELQAKELELSAEVKQAYFEYAFIDESIGETLKIKELLSNISRIAETRYSIGQVSQQDLIKAQVEASIVNNDIISLEAKREIAAAGLKSLMNIAQESAIGAPEALSRGRVSIDTAALIKTALENNPEIKMMEREAEAHELNAKLAQKTYYPDFMVGVAPIQRDGRFDSYDLMFQINIPVWRGRYDLKAKEARYGAQSKRAMVMAEKNAKGYEVKQAAVEVESTDRMRALYETSLLPQVEMSFESALKNYQLGKVDFLTLLDTGRELKRTKIDYLRLLAEYHKKTAMLEKAIGGQALNPFFSPQSNAGGSAQGGPR